MNEKTQRQFLVNYIIDKMTVFLIEDRQITLEQALDIIYNSRVYDLLLDETADLTLNSPAYNYELLKQELNSNLLTPPSCHRLNRIILAFLQ